MCDVWSDYGYVPSSKASPRTGRYQIILPGDRGTCGRTTCPGLHSTARRPAFEPKTSQLQVQHTNTNTKPNLATNQTVHSETGALRTHLVECSRAFGDSAARLPILLLHLGQTVLRHAEAGQRLFQVVVEVVLARRDLLHCPMNVVV